MKMSTVHIIFYVSTIWKVTGVSKGIASTDDCPDVQEGMTHYKLKCECSVVYFLHAYFLFRIEKQSF